MKTNPQSRNSKIYSQRILRILKVLISLGWVAGAVPMIFATDHAAAPFQASQVLPAAVIKYADGRPAAVLRLDAQDQGVILAHGDGPNQCDYLGARDIWVMEANGTY